VPETSSQLELAGLLDHQVQSVLHLASLTGSDWESQLESDAMKAAGRQLGQAISALEAMGLAEWIDVDLSIVRGLAYYTGTVFELFDAKRTLRAICGGGRYDSLVGSVGGQDLSALGFGMGDVVLGELLKERGMEPSPRSEVDVFIASVTPDDVPETLRLAHELRDGGARVEYSLSTGAVGKQLTLANSRGAALAIVIGPDDRIRGEVQVKHLAAKDQQAISRTAIGAHVRSFLTTHDSRLTTPHG
jgi:histidyl-tRNA synthetase